MLTKIYKYFEELNAEYGLYPVGMTMLSFVLGMVVMFIIK